MLGVEIFLPALAVLVDRVVGDPHVRWHPVVLMGTLIGWLEKKLRFSQHSPRRKRLAGLLLVVIVLLISYLVSWAVIRGLGALSPWLAWIGGAVLLAFTVTPRSLAEAGMEIRQYLDAGDLATARTKVSWIVGRDTERLEEGEVVRATVETVAENIVDGIIAPLFYAFIGGVPLAYLYRSVNTLDSMVGYKNDKYFDFGKVAARTDDCFNYIPARITGVLIVLAAFLLGYSAKGAVSAIGLDAAKHPSPNSGITEAGVAGALSVRLGGYNSYGGQVSFRAYMGQALNVLRPVHIGQTIRIMQTVTVLFIIAATLLAVMG